MHDGEPCISTRRVGRARNSGQNTGCGVDVEAADGVPVSCVQEAAGLIDVHRGILAGNLEGRTCHAREGSGSSVDGISDNEALAELRWSVHVQVFPVWRHSHTKS